MTLFVCLFVVGLVMERMHMSLNDLIHSAQNIDFNIRRRILYDVAAGLAVLHGYNIEHRDMKPANVLVRLFVHR